jgi:RNA polymerase sigma factor (TIGR02999 family)
MRRILVNYAEARNAQKRGGGAVPASLMDADLALSDPEIEELLAIDRALSRLREFNQRGADVVVYRFFGGLTYDEIAEVIGTSAVTARRAWSVAKSWLRRELRETLPGWDGSRLSLGSPSR